MTSGLVERESVGPSREAARYDVVVLGSGLAGMSAAWAASKRGRRVLVVEKQRRPGGSTSLSAGMFWTAPDFDAYREQVPPR